MIADLEKQQFVGEPDHAQYASMGRFRQDSRYPDTVLISRIGEMPGQMEVKKLTMVAGHGYRRPSTIIVTKTLDRRWKKPELKA